MRSPHARRQGKCEAVASAWSAYHMTGVPKTGGRAMRANDTRAALRCVLAARHSNNRVRPFPTHATVYRSIPLHQQSLPPHTDLPGDKSLSTTALAFAVTGRVNSRSLIFYLQLNNLPLYLE